MNYIRPIKTTKKPFKHQAVRIITCSALAAILAMGPNLYDSDGGFFSYPEAQARSCFIAGTKILMADGSTKAIQAVRHGDYVIGHQGRLNRVIGIEQVALAGRRLYRLNGGGFFVTAEHPFMSAQGWKSIDPTMTQQENPQLRLQSLQVGDQLYRFKQYQLSLSHQGNLALQPTPAVDFELIELRQIDSIEADPETQVYNLLLDGNHSYIADDYLVHNKGGDDGGSDGGDSDGGGSGGDDSDSGSSGDNSGSGSDDDGDNSRSGSSDDDDRTEHSNNRDDDNHGRRGLGRGQHGFTHQFGSSQQSRGADDSVEDHHSNSDQGRGRGADDAVEGHRSDDDEGRGRGRGRGRGADDAVEGHRSDGDHSSDEDRTGDRGRGRGADDAVEGHRSPGSHSSKDFSPSGSDMSRDEEASAIANGWK